jgi:hypothetical protein
MGDVASGAGINAKRIQKYHRYTFLHRYIIPLVPYLRRPRLSGYILLALLLATAHLGGAWSRWAIARTSNVTRLIIYTIAPTMALISVYARAR